MFFKSSLAEAEVVRDILLRFELVSVQAVNYGKFEVMFNSNIHTDKQNEILVCWVLMLLKVILTILDCLQFLVILNGLFFGF